MLLALIFCIWSMHEKSRLQATKVMAISFICGLSLFSHHVSTYFAAIFIIATAVTELDFLQNLAAIIRGNKEYFDYKKRELTQEEKDAKETREEKLLNPELPTTQDVPQAARSWQEIESAAMDTMEKYFGKKMERGVKITGKRKASIEVDGLIEGDETADIIVEIKYLRSAKGLNSMYKQLDYYEHKMAMYKELTGRRGRLHVVMVVDKKDEASEKLYNQLTDRVDHSLLIFGASVLTLADIGINA